MANGRAGRCHSKSHFCPLRAARPALTERGSQGEGEERGKEPTGAFFSRRGFLSISVRLSKQEAAARSGAGERAGVGSECGRTEQVNAPVMEADPLHMQPQKPGPTGMDSINSYSAKTIKSPFNVSAWTSWLEIMTPLRHRRHHADFREMHEASCGNCTSLKH